jgi:hypothetical protein
VHIPFFISVRKITYLNRSLIFDQFVVVFGRVIVFLFRVLLSTDCTVFAVAAFCVTVPCSAEAQILKEKTRTTEISSFFIIFYPCTQYPINQLVFNITISKEKAKKIYKKKLPYNTFKLFINEYA